MALVLLDRAKETTTVVGIGTATLLGAVTSYQSLAGVGNGNTTYYCIVDQAGANWEVGIGTYTASGTTLARTTVLSSSNAGALVVFTAGVKDVFVTYPAEKGVWLDASNNAIGLGTPAAFVGTNITGTASGLTAGNVTTNANLTGAVTSTGNATSLGSFTSLQLATALTDETGSGSAVFATSPTLANPTYTGTLTGSTGILNIGSGQLYKDASGNVAIGNNVAYSKLDVFGGATVRGNLEVTVAAGISANFNSSAGGYQAITNYNGTSSISLSTNGSSTELRTTTNSPQLFYTNNTERMRIDSSGNVGIGTSSPACRLNVVSGTNSGIQVYDGTVNTLIYNIGSNTSVIGTNTNHPLALYTNNAERMRIDSSGNVGIGTTANNVFDQVGGARPLVVQKADANTTVNGSTASVTITNANTTTNNTAQLNFAAITGVSTNQYSSAVISCIFGARTNAQYPTGQLTFSTSTTLNAAPTEKMRIDSSGNLLFNSGYGSVATAYGCRAWVNFNGTGTVAIRASGNVSSITDNGTGDYTVNFTTAMPDANYAWSGNACYASLHQTMIYRSDVPQTYSTTALRLGCIAQSGASDTYSDGSVIGIHIFR